MAFSGLFWSLWLDSFWLNLFLNKSKSLRANPTFRRSVERREEKTWGASDDSNSTTSGLPCCSFFRREIISTLVLFFVSSRLSAGLPLRVILFRPFCLRFSNQSPSSGSSPESVHGQLRRTPSCCQLLTSPDPIPSLQPHHQPPRPVIIYPVPLHRHRRWGFPTINLPRIVLR